MSALTKVIIYSLASAVGISVVFGAGVASAAGLLDALRERRAGAGVAWGALAAVCVLGTVVAVVLGLIVMTAKS